ncbi:hypothetical protein AURDEDRAFT_173713 [Auricularia subglabra TFB-10046 SS5]|uniref:Uncharacterized protein n=1 Tax=Auricularia subglabra (strain TFB-10046 / SS5) TaxID=717982 RepID=J0CZN6_AURST|nr:hypothetical protein AURDEDRAFT_173713 [Auricularia subglabra TFB-10046 SS5]
MPKAKKTHSKVSTPSEVQKTARAGTDVTAEGVHPRAWNLRERPAARTSAAAAPTKQPRKCKTCGRPRLGHPRQCQDGPSVGRRRDELEDAAARREAESKAEEALFLARAEPPQMQHKMQLDGHEQDVSRDDESERQDVMLPPALLPVNSTVVPPVAAPVVPPVAAPVVPPVDSTVVRPVDSTVVPPVDASKVSAVQRPLPPAPKKQKTSKKIANDDGAEEPGEEPLDGGLKSTPKGDVLMPLKRSAKSKEAYDSRSASKKTTEMFQSIAMQGDLLASRVPGWAFLIFVPMQRRGEMRSWTSPQVRNDVPDLPGEVRKLIFERLEPFREQADEEREMILTEKENLLKEKDSELERYKRIAEEAERRAQEKEQEAEALRAAYSAASKLVT